MRKDVKIGLAVGGILFVVVLSYVLFFTGPKPKATADAGQKVPAVVPPVAVEPARAHRDTVRTNIIPPRNPEGDVAIVPPPSPVVAPPPPPVETTYPGDSVATAPLTPAGSGDWDTLLSSGPAAISHTATPQTTPPLTPPGQNFVAPPDHGAVVIPPLVASPAVAPTTPVSPNGSHIHVVKQGENYWSIAVAEYGSGTYMAQLMSANPTVPANRLRPEMKIVIPAKEKIAAAVTTSAGPTTRPIDPAREYRVKSGDSLYSISTALYGKADHVDKLYALNKDAIGPDQRRLKLNMVLKLPEPPKSAGSATGATAATGALDVIH